MLKIWTDTSPDTASTSISTKIISGLDAFESMQIVAVLTGATGGTLDVYLQMCDDPDGSVWIDYAHFPQVSAGAAASTLLYTVTRQKERLTGLAVAIGDTPALAAGTVAGGDFGSKMRVIMVAGASTSAGAAQTIYFAGSPARKRV